MAMTDAAAIAPALDLAARDRAAEAPLRAATRGDLSLIHTRLMEAIRTSPYYSDEFKAYETRRLTRGYLEALLEADPWHIAIMQHKGEVAGFMISGPELGTLWLYWSYVFPEKRKSAMALLAMRNFIQHWDNGRFHKVATYTKPGNDAAAAIMERFGWALTATLQRHIFGEDYLLYEHPLTKTVPGYDHGARIGRMAQLKRSVKRLLGR
jgi:RimJ/RimL family protein N-acetyltransferase